MSSPLNKTSCIITQFKSQGASQAMLYVIGMSEEDMNKAQVGIASIWYEGNPCNMHLNELGGFVKEGVVGADLIGMRFNTIGVSDGISMGTDPAVDQVRAPLVSHVHHARARQAVEVEHHGALVVDQAAVEGIVAHAARDERCVIGDRQLVLGLDAELRRECAAQKVGRVVDSGSARDDLLVEDRDLVLGEEEVVEPVVYVEQRVV